MVTETERGNGDRDRDRGNSPIQSERGGDTAYLIPINNIYREEETGAIP